MNKDKRQEYMELFYYVGAILGTVLFFKLITWLFM